MFDRIRTPVRALVKWALLIPALLVASAATTPAAADFNDISTGDAGNQWRFRVFLDDREIGYHSFRVEQVGEYERVEIEASFDIRILFFNAYQYRHSNVEYWRDGCLQRIDSATDDNGDPYRLTGESRSDAFVYATADERNLETAACTRSFAYWNPESLQAGELLNAQTGELIQTRLERAADDRLVIDGAVVPAERYRLIMEDGAIVLWYAKDTGQWLALEAPAPGGRTLRYEPVALPVEAPDLERLAQN